MERRTSIILAATLVAVLVAAGIWFVLDEPDASCGTDAGPAAVVGVSTDGTVRWTRLVGHAAEVTAGDGVVAVESREVSATLDAATGATVSCRDLEPQVVDQPAQASTSIASPDSPDRPAVTFVDEVDTTDWRVRRGIPTEWTGGQSMLLAVETAAGEPLWEKPVPGFVVQIAHDRLLVIDQTNGTGNFDQGAWFPTLLTSYAIRTGEPQWSTTVPGAPHEVVGAGDLIAIPGGGDLHGIDPASGEVVWTTTLGNPGRTRHYSEAGGVSDIGYDEATGTIVAVVPARAEYRD